MTEGPPPVTVIATGFEVAVAPSLSAPWKNSTLATLPSMSVALAVRVTFAGAVKVAPAAGAVSETVGGMFPPDDAAEPQASSSLMRDQPGAPVMSTRMRSVVRAGKVIRRHTRLLPAMLPPGTVAQAMTVQYCT